MKILILFGHPAFQKSKVNRSLVCDITSIPNVTFHDLYEAYPEMDIDIDAEQKLLLEHDCIIFQYPFYWYSAPAIFKEWQDLVLEHGWAYGSQGRQLQGKYFLSVITTGATYTAYNHGQTHGHKIKDFLTCLDQMARLCYMTPLPPFVIHGALTKSFESCTGVREKYHKVLGLLANDMLEMNEVLKMEYINDCLKVEVEDGK